MGATPVLKLPLSSTVDLAVKGILQNECSFTITKQNVDNFFMFAKHFCSRSQFKSAAQTHSRFVSLV